jgi:hypothetical protein
MNRKCFFALLLSPLFFGCSDVDDLLTFEVSDQVEMTIASSTPLNLPFELSTPDVTTNSSQKFENNNTKAELVKDIKLKSLDLTILAPAEGNFNFLKSIEIYIATTEENEILLASLPEVPTNVSSISLTPTDQKLDTYVKASSYKLRTKIVTKETLSHDVDLEADIRFRVTADPL